MIIASFDEMNRLAEELEAAVSDHELLRFNSASIGRAQWTDALKKEFLERFSTDDNGGATTLALYIQALKEALGQKSH